MTCSACGAENPAGKRFCSECGAALATLCQSCGAPVDASKRFCGDCGAALTADAPAVPISRQRSAPAPEPIAERRVCSVLFCDLVEFTPLSESRDPEEIRELLSRYFDTARTVIGRYGGVVEKFIGDAVMAVWGAPTASEGDAERAVRAAIDLVDAVADLGRTVGADQLAARAGVVTGEVAVTIGAVGEGMVAGDTVNTAARVQSTAPAGAVLVDESTWRIARGSIAFDEAGQHSLKGKSELVSLWRARRVVSGAAGSQRIDGLEAPLVGRDADLRLIKDLFHASADRGTARLVSVIGPAGVGKSRLGWEFYRYIDGLATVVAWHRGRCLSYGDGVAFWALAEMVRQRLNIAEEDTADVAAAKLDAGLDGVVPDPAVRQYVRPRIARLLGVESEDAGPLSREELFAGWRTFFEQIAAVDPVVMLIEDLHYADSGLLDFLEHLLDWSRDVPLFVLTLARPELEDRRPGWGTGRRNGTSLSLEPLDDTAMDAMIDGLVIGMPDSARAAVAEQSQGIPLYAVETVRMLIDRDVVQPVEGVYRLVGDIGQLAVPDTLQSLLAARLDSLDPKARRLVADAAVLGGTFPPEALVAVSGMSDHEVQELLADLVRREVLMVRADPLSPDRGQYGFVQTLFRQVAYETLSRRERKARHVAVADHLARAFSDEGEELAEVIAQHLLDALAAVPDDDDVAAIRQRAVDTLRRAADRAQRTGALAVAARALSTAADLMHVDGDLRSDLAAADMLERAGWLLIEAGELKQAEAGYAQARQLYQQHDNQRLAARAAVGLGESMRRQSRLEEAGRVLREAIEVLDADPDEDTVSALRALAVLEAFSSNVDLARGYVDEAFRLAQALGLSSSSYVDLFITQGLVFDVCDHHVQAVAAYREAARLADAVGMPGAFGRANLNLSDSLLAQGWWPTAIEIAERSLATLRQIGSSQWSFVTGNLLQALFFAGRWDDADQVIRRSLSEGADDPFLAWMVILLATLRGMSDIAEHIAVVHRLTDSEDAQDRMMVATVDCLVATASGAHKAALEHAHAAIADGEKVGIASEGIRFCWPLAAEAALAMDDLAEVQRLLAWCDERAQGHLHPVVRADRLRIKARLLAAQGSAEAGPTFERAVATLRDIESPYHLAVCLADEARYLASVGEPSRAEQSTAEAAVIARRLGAAPLLHRIEATATSVTSV